MKHYNVKEYYGDRPCIDPVSMQELQIRCRSEKPAKKTKLATLLNTIRNIIK